MPIDYSKYCDDWKARSWFVRKIRGRDQCEGSPIYPDCRAVNGEAHPVTGSKVVLTVAHIDHDIGNNSLYNLRGLCQRCHLTHDARHHATNRRRNKDQANGQLLLDLETVPPAKPTFRQWAEQLSK